MSLLLGCLNQNLCFFFFNLFLLNICSVHAAWWCDTWTCGTALRTIASAIPQSPVRVIVCFLWWEPCSPRLLAAVKFIIQYPWPQPLCRAFSLQDTFISEFQVCLKQDHCLQLFLKSLVWPGRSPTLLCNATCGLFKGRQTTTQTHLIFVFWGVRSG